MGEAGHEAISRVLALREGVEVRCIHCHALVETPLEDKAAGYTRFICDECVKRAEAGSLHKADDIRPPCTRCKSSLFVNSPKPETEPKPDICGQVESNPAVGSWPVSPGVCSLPAGHESNWHSDHGYLSWKEPKPEGK